MNSNKEWENRWRKRFLELLVKQKELSKKLRTQEGKYSDLRKIALELEQVEDKLYDGNVFGKEDIPYALGEFETRRCSNIYYRLGFQKEDHLKRHDNYYPLYGYLTYVPPFSDQKEYAMYLNLRGGSTNIHVKDRHDFERENFIIVGKRLEYLYRNAVGYNKLMEKCHDEIMDDFYKYQRIYHEIAMETGDAEEAANETYYKYGKRRVLSK